MPRRVGSGFRGGFSRRPKKAAFWQGAASIAPTTIAGGASAIFDVVPNSIMNGVLQGRIERLRYRIVVVPTTAGQDPIVEFGVGVFNLAATAAAELPTALQLEAWMAMGQVFAMGPAIGSTTAGPGTNAVLDGDVRSKRRFDAQDHLVVRFDEVTIHSVELYFWILALVIPD